MSHEAAMLKSIDGKTMPLLGVSAHGKVNGLLFELSVEQRYRNATKKNVEAVYTFPLPFAAVLLDMEIRLGEKLLHAVVVEKSNAEAEYEEAIDKGDTAIMLERAADGMLTLNLGNLMAGEEATIRYRYAQLLRFEHGSVRLTVPTVIAPRYGNPADGGLQPHQIPGSDLGVAYPFTLSLQLQGTLAAGTIASPSHAIAMARSEDGLTVTLDSAAALDRDFVLTVAGLPARSVAVVAMDKTAYVVLAGFCADVPRAAAELPLRLKVLVDCSGSMGGDSIEAAKRALHRVFAGLTAADHFSYSRFGTEVHHDIDGLVPADAAAIRRMGTLLAQTDASMGGTEMASALRSVFGMEADDGAADVLLITDGEIFGADALLDEARAAHQRVFVVGVGSAPAEGLLHRLADATGGACEFVAPAEDVEAGILRMFARLRAPRVARTTIAWPATPTWVTPLPQALFGGETVHVFAGFDALPSGDVELQMLSGEHAPLTARTTLPVAVSASDTLARMAAAMRLSGLKAKAQLALALDYSLLTHQTNMLVVHARMEGEKAQDLPALQKIAQMHAAGWGGVGSVRRVRYSREVRRSVGVNTPSAAIESYCMDASAVLPKFRGSQRKATDAFAGIGTLAVASRYDRDRPPENAATLETIRSGRFTAIGAFMHALDARFMATGLGTLPTTLDDLDSMGLDRNFRADIARFIDAGADEDAVIRAFLAALLPWADKLGCSRQLRRALRLQFKRAGEHLSMRTEVAIMVG